MIKSELATTNTLNNIVSINIIFSAPLFERYILKALPTDIVKPPPFDCNKISAVTIIDKKTCINLKIYILFVIPRAKPI